METNIVVLIFGNIWKNYCTCKVQRVIKVQLSWGVGNEFGGQVDSFIFVNYGW